MANNDIVQARRSPLGVRYAAMSLGTLGALLSVITIVALIWTASTATSTVDRAFAPITATLERLDSRLGALSTRIESATTAGEVQAQLSNAADLVNATNDALTIVTANPVVAALPIDTTPLTSAIGQVADTANAAVGAGTTGDNAAAPASGPMKAAAVKQVTAVQTRLAGVQTQVDTVSSQLRRVIRLTALVCILLALWALWAQVTLARSGRRRRAG